MKLRKQTSRRLGVFGETQAKKVLGYWQRRTFLAFCVRTEMVLYDAGSQEHAWLLSFLSVEKQTTFSAGYEEKRETGFFFRPIREEHRNKNSGAREAVLPGGLF